MSLRAYEHIFVNFEVLRHVIKRLLHSANVCSRQSAVTLAPEVCAWSSAAGGRLGRALGRRQHPIEQTLLASPAQRQHFAAHLVEDGARRLHLLRGRHLQVAASQFRRQLLP